MFFINISSSCAKGNYNIKITNCIFSFIKNFCFIYYIPYSKGTRSGELIKISNRGVVFKTWEGEISQGISGAQIFYFSVLDKDKKVINKLNEYQGTLIWMLSDASSYLNGAIIPVEGGRSTW